MYWRLPNRQFQAQSGEGNRAALKDIVSEGSPVGLIAYSCSEPAGWCAIAPREEYTRLERSRVLARVDKQPVWSVPCFFVAKKYRRKGLTVTLLQAAVRYAQEQGARIVEGYPIDPKTSVAPDVFVYTGLVSAFIKAGFTEVARRSETRPVMRLFIST
jgi:GNAT superfamily N-acetyltransferase